MVATSDPVRSADFDFKFHQAMIEADGEQRMPRCGAVTFL
jgi:hypothetical protein